MKEKEFQKIIQEYLPENSADLISRWAYQYKLYFTITRERKTKAGDFKVDPYNGALMISVNHNLNKYAFLITVVHEIAHALVYLKYGRNVKPHGNQWKLKFRELMLPFMGRNVFPDDIMRALAAYLQNPKASTGSDHNLVRALRNYDKKPADTIILDDLQDGDIFELQGMIFKREHKRRTRYLVTEQKTKRQYLINAMVEVKPKRK